MKYMGSKNRLSKELAPIIQKYIDDNNCNKYLEPFVGGANMIDKIKCKHRFGSDTHKYLIAFLKALSNTPFIILETFSSEYSLANSTASSQTTFSGAPLT